MPVYDLSQGWILWALTLPSYSWALPWPLPLSLLCLSDLLATLAFFLFLKDRSLFLCQDLVLVVLLPEILDLRDLFLFIISG